jgi:hypothetical protein
LSGQNRTVTIVNHVAVDIAASPDAVWRAILDEYVEAKKFREVYAVKPIDDPAAVLGGYRMVAEQDGAVIDDRICHITERDNDARRLSLFADYLSVPGGMQVYATYHAQENGSAARYALDCHAHMSMEAPGAGSREEIATAIDGMKAQFDAALIGYLESVKTRLEIDQ